MPRQPIQPSDRIAWVDVPATVRADIARIAGSDVAADEMILDGFSPGLVARLHLADGRSVFVKACPEWLNARTPAMHRREGEVLRGLRKPAAPPLLGVVEADGWTGIITAYVEGLRPALVDRDLESVFTLAQSLGTAAPVLRAHIDALQDDFLWFGLRRLIERDGALPGDWADEHRSTLLGLEGRLVEAVHGSALVHGDLRADNVIIEGNGDALAVDWPAAAQGHPLFDSVLLVGSLAMDGDVAATELACRCPMIDAADPDHVDVLLAGFLGHYRWASSLGVPPGLPGVRAYQAALAGVFERWLADRLP